MCRELTWFRVIDTASGSDVKLHDFIAHGDCGQEATTLDGCNTMRDRTISVGIAFATFPKHEKARSSA